MCKTDQMKHLLTAIACFFALSMSAQEALPWNPNANNDNIIGTVDLLAMLNVYGEEYSVQTCFKGDLCKYVYYEGTTHYSDVGCGTIVVETIAAGEGISITINLTNEGYVAGDVLHLIHQWRTGSNGEQAVFKTLIENTWTIVAGLSPNSNYTGRVIFNGEYWEELD